MKDNESGDDEDDKLMHGKWGESEGDWLVKHQQVDCLDKFIQDTTQYSLQTHKE